MYSKYFFIYSFLPQITLRFNQEMTPIVGKLLGACLFGLKDRNNVVRKYSASAIGHLVGVAKVIHFHSFNGLLSYPTKTSLTRNNP